MANANLNVTVTIRPWVMPVMRCYCWFTPFPLRWIGWAVRKWGLRIG